MLAKYQVGGVDPGGIPGNSQFRGDEPRMEAAPGEGVFAILWGRKILLILCTAVALGTTLLYLQRATPMYSSTARVSIEESVVRFMGNSFATPISPQFLATQGELIKSTKVLELAETRLKALKAPDGSPKNLKTFAGESRFIAGLQANLTVQLDPKVNIIEVSFISPYPRDAADVVNTVVAAYEEFHQSETHQDSAEVLSAAQAEKKKRETELADAVKRLNELRKEHSSLGSPEALVARMTELSSAYTLAQIKVAEAKAATLPNHPSVELSIQHERRLAEVLAQAREEMAQADSAREDLLQSQQDVTRLRDQVDQADKLVKEAAAAAATHNGAARIIPFEDGRPELSPVRPHKAQLLALSVVLGLILGGAAAVLLDRLDQRISSPADVISILRVPILGTVPLIKGPNALGVCGRHVHLDPMSRASEAYRAIWKAICFGVRGEPGRTVLVTSPAAGDGKSTTAANLALAMHQSGERVLLVDADLRRPIQHLTFSLPNKTGLSNVLSGKCSVHEAIQKSALKGLDVLTSGPTPRNPAEVLRRSSLDLFLQEASGEYDRVIVDSPPVTTVSDTLTLAALCGVTLLTVRAGKSTRGIAAEARDSLLSVGANLLGAVINGSRGGRSGYRAYTGLAQTTAFNALHLSATPTLRGGNESGSGNGNGNGNGNGYHGTNGNGAMSTELVVTSTVDAMETPARPHRGHADRDVF